jgi:hypothetical protein
MSTQSKISNLEESFTCPVCGNRFYTKKGLDCQRKMTQGAETLKFIIEQSFSNNEYGIVSDDALSKAIEKYA